jgi:hypothetical protein
MEITVNNYKEFEEIVQNKDFRIASTLYKVIMDNLNTKKRSIHFLTINILEEQEVVDLSVERPYFASTLEELLPHYIEREMYEDCKLIKETIINLKNK